MPDWQALLPGLRGKLRVGAALAPLTWFRVGGAAGALFRPADRDDLAQALQQKPKALPHLLLGVGSNMLIRDGGLPDTLVIRLGGSFGEIHIDGLRITAGAAQLDARVAQAAAEAGIGGLAFFAGIPGTIGGALRMNAGAHGSETSARLLYADLLDAQGQPQRLNAADMGMRYRHSEVPDDWIFLSATFEGEPSDAASEREKIAAVKAAREATQPIREKTGGSTFKNPAGHSAWKLIDQSGGRGLTVGGARMSDLHCNFMLNVDNASAWDLESLGETIRQRVWAQQGIALEWEIKRLGLPAADQQAVPTLESLLA